MSVLDEIASTHAGLPWLAKNTILLTKCGSKAHGTSTPTSDDDLKGVAVPPSVYFYGFSKKFEQAEAHSPYDAVIYDVRKFCALAADCNPSIIEVLFTDEADVVHVDARGKILRDRADRFLSKKAKHTFSGYAHSQLKRIQGHHAWLRNPPKAKPTRADYGLPESTVIPKDQLLAAQAAVKKKLAGWNLDLEPLDPATRILVEERVSAMLGEIGLTTDDLWRNAGRSIGVDENFLHLMELERKYTNAQNNWTQYQTWVASRNPARAALEAQWGYDTKHAMHLVRLLRMGLEILSEGKVLVKRPDADELLSIRNGAWSYDRLLAYSESMGAAIEAAYVTSKLPHAPDRDALDELCQWVAGG